MKKSSELAYCRSAGCSQGEFRAGASVGTVRAAVALFYPDSAPAHC